MRRLKQFCEVKAICCWGPCRTKGRMRTTPSIASAIKVGLDYFQESFNKRALATSHSRQTLPMLFVTDYRVVTWKQSSFAPNVFFFSPSQRTEGVSKLPTGTEHESEIFVEPANALFMSFTHYFTFRVTKTLYTPVSAQYLPYVITYLPGKKTR